MPTDLPPGYRGPQSDRPPQDWSGLIGLVVICATIVAVVYMLTR